MAGPGVRNEAGMEILEEGVPHAYLNQYLGEAGKVAAIRPCRRNSIHNFLRSFRRE
jgi:hypothetical protein